MKHLLTMLFVFVLLGVQAQTDQKTETKEERQQRYIDEVNPFRELGYKPKIATLSKGKYREAFPDTIVQIGSFTYNVLSKQVTGVVVTENLGLSEADLKPDIVSRWMSPDPLSEEFPDKSPYNFTNNNPIFFTDPTGLAPQGLLDDYGIDKNGNITLLKKTNDNTDTLYATTTNENGETVKDESKGSVTVSKNSEGNSLVSDLANNGTTEQYDDYGTTKERNVNIAVTDEKNKNDVFKLFKFVADNSNVEWSVGKISYQGLGTNYQIGTFHDTNLSPGVRNSKIGNVLGLLHSHPNQPTSRDRSESIGGDTSLSTSFLKRHGSDKPYLIYFPNTQNTSRLMLPKESFLVGSAVRKRNNQSIKF